MIRFTDKQIGNGRNVWTVSGVVVPGQIVLHEIHGDTTDGAGIREALQRMIDGRTRYGRVVYGFAP